MIAQSRVKGVMISYIVTIVRSLSNFLLTKLYLKVLGIDGYGFYQYIYSIASYAMILDFGINQVITKYVVEFRTKEDSKGIENTLFYTLMITLAAILIIIALGCFVLFNISNLYGELSPDKYRTAFRLVVLVIIYMLGIIVQHYLEGILLAFEKYITLRVINLTQILIFIVLVIALLFTKIGAVAIALSNVVAVFICVILTSIYVKSKIRVKAKYHFYNKSMAVGSLKLSSSLCVQSIVLFLNTSIDKFVLGRMLDDVAVAIYSIALSFSQIFDELPSIIQRVYLPQSVKLISNKATGEELTDFVIRPGRIQFMLCGAIFGGFVLFGKLLITLWSGPETIFAWWIAILLMGASIIPLVENVCLTFLTALNKRMYRSVVLILVAVLNLVLTVVFVKELGIVGAPLGSFIALILGNTICMNIYYKRVIKINVMRMLKGIFRGTWICVLLAMLSCVPVVIFINGRSESWLWLICGCIIYAGLYAMYLWKLGMQTHEKNMVLNFMARFRKNA